MRYWYPFTEQALEEIKRDKVEALVILPLYPQFSISTSGSSLRVLQETFAKDLDSWGEDRILHTVVPAWYDRPGYVHSMAGLIANELHNTLPRKLKMVVCMCFSHTWSSAVLCGSRRPVPANPGVRSTCGDELNALGWGEVTFTDQAISGSDNKAKGRTTILMWTVEKMPHGKLLYIYPIRVVSVLSSG